MGSVVKLDLHGVKHEDCAITVENWYYMWSSKQPGFTGTIICGNSSKMKQLVTTTLSKIQVEYIYMKDGTIVVNDRL